MHLMVFFQGLYNILDTGQSFLNDWNLKTKKEQYTCGHFQHGTVNTTYWRPTTIVCLAFKCIKEVEMRFKYQGFYMV